MNTQGLKNLDRGPLITIGLALGMVAIFVAGVYLPNERRLASAKAELREAEGQLADAVSLAEQLPAATARVEAMQEEYARCLGRVPGGPVVPQFLESVADLLQAEGIVQRELVPQKDQVKESYTELPIAITFEGPFPAVYRALSRLEHLERTNHVESVKFTMLPRGEGQVRVEMRVKVYYQQSPPAKGGQVAKVERAGNT